MSAAGTKACLKLFMCCVCGMIGCSGNSETAARNDTIEPQIPVVRGEQLRQYLLASDCPVLVEFGVDFNCPRCAQTKTDVVRLRQSLHGKVDVVRVDFNSNAKLVAELGGSICPTYALFDGEQHVFTRSFPLSIDLLEGEILRQIETF